MKLLFGISTSLVLLFLLTLQSGLSSCTKEVTKHDTTILIHKDTVLIVAKDTIFQMDVAAWNCFSTSNNSYLSSGTTTYLNTSEGIKFFPQAPRTGVRLETKTELGFKDKTIYYKWKANGGGQFADFVLQVKYDPLTVDGRPPIQGVDFGEFSVQSSLNGSTLIQDDTWYYTRVKSIAGSDNFQCVTATGNYDNKGGTIITTQTIPVYTKNGFIAIRIGDDYNTNTYCVLAECKIASN